MQTTLRINDQLYRAAKAEAAREGITLTRFLENAIHMRLNKSLPKTTGKPHRFRVYQPDKPLSLSNVELRRIADEEQEKYDLSKLAIRQSTN